MPVDVLLVDDDAVQASTRKLILERSGLSVRLATHAPEALRFLQSGVESTVRCIITDHLMPGMNGPEFVVSLRRSGFSSPVLVLSGYADAEDIYESLDVVFRMKPFPPDQLIALVQYLIAAHERRSA